VPAASGPSWIEATAGLAAGLGVLVGVDDGIEAVLGAATLGDAEPPADGCPVVQPVMASSATTTTAPRLRFMANSSAIGGVDPSGRT
jgi:hypothetical protein